MLILDTAIPALPANAFRGFTILRIVLNRCTLSQIDDNAFDGPLLDSLVELDLSDNQLGGVPQTGVPRLRNLRKLYLNRNRINQLDSNSFIRYESRDLLQKLELASNRLTNQGLGDSTVFRPLRFPLPSLSFLLYYFFLVAVINFYLYRLTCFSWFYNDSIV